MPTLRLQSPHSFLNAASPENSLIEDVERVDLDQFGIVRQLEILGLERVEIELVVVELIGIVRAFFIELRVAHLGFDAHAVAQLGFVKAGQADSSAA